MAGRVKATDVLVAQFSSIGSMGGTENKKWPDQFTASLCGGAAAGRTPPLSIVYPSVSFTWLCSAPKCAYMCVHE